MEQEERKLYWNIGATREMESSVHGTRENLTEYMNSLRHPFDNAKSYVLAWGNRSQKTLARRFYVFRFVEGTEVPGITSYYGFLRQKISFMLNRE